MTRQIVLDTETTGLEVDLGHRVIEIGCVELVNRRPTNNNFHHYVHPESKEIDAGAEAVHGISMAKLDGKPAFRVLAQQLWDYLKGAELIIHNAAFDMGFLRKEFERAGFTQSLDSICTVTDTVVMARKLHPGQRVNLDALCKRYGVDNSNREFHGALLDARLLADVYLAMTGGQSRLTLDEGSGGTARRARFAELLAADPQSPLPVLQATEAELEVHRARLQKMADKGKCLWQGELPAVH
jgi:DNA polymerase-3 subunit epsilon